MNSPATERRRFPRVGFDGLCVLEHNQHNYPAMLIDICQDGALVHTELTLGIEPGELAGISIQLAESTELIQLQTRLVQHDGNLLRFRAEPMDEATTSHLRELVAKELGDPEILERNIDQLAG